MGNSVVCLGLSCGYLLFMFFCFWGKYVVNIDYVNIDYVVCDNGKIYFEFFIKMLFLYIYV